MTYSDSLTFLNIENNVYGQEVSATPDTVLPNYLATTLSSVTEKKRNCGKIVKHVELTVCSF